jgi:Regulator of chromosome condensation (RCC1) repeat
VGDAPGADFRSVGGGYEHSCGLRRNDKAVCWGINDYGKTSETPTSVSFRFLSVGGAHNCGIKLNDRVKCWGSDDASQVSDTPRRTRFRVVDAASY